MAASNQLDLSAAVAAESTRTARCVMRLTAADREQLLAAAADAGLPPATWARAAVRHALAQSAARAA